MIVYWDGKRRDELIKHCINSLSKAKGITIEIRDVNTSDNPEAVILWTRVWAKAVYTQSFGLYYKDMAEALNIKGGELDLNNLSDKKLIKLGEFIIKTIWDSLFVYMD